MTAWSQIHLLPEVFQSYVRPRGIFPDVELYSYVTGC